MRFMMLVIPKGYATAKPGAMPDPKMVAAMGRYNDKLHASGHLLAMDGLHPPSTGARVTFPGGKAKVTDGPFAEAKEVLGGYWMIDVKSKAEAIKWARQIPGGDDMTVEIRQVQEFDDFPDAVKNAAKSEPRIRKELEKKRKAATKTAKK